MENLHDYAQIVAAAVRNEVFGMVERGEITAAQAADIQNCASEQFKLLASQKENGLVAMGLVGLVITQLLDSE